MVFRFVHYIVSIVLLAFFPISTYAGWTPPVRISDEALAHDPRIVTNGDMLHVVYWILTGHTESYYLKNADGGEIWEDPFRLGDSLVSQGEVSPLIRIKGDTMATIWNQNMPGGGQYNLGFRRSTNGGEAWGEVSYILSSNGYQLQKHTFFLGDSSMFLIFSYIAQQEIAVEFTKSTDWGETWSEPTEVFRTEQTGRFDIAAREDDIHFVWVGRFDYEQDWETYYIKSEDGGDSWTDNMLLSTLDTRGSNWPSISQNSRGDIIVGWMDYKYSPYLITGDLFVRYSFDAGNSWTEEEQLTFHHLVFPLRVLWSGDSIHVGWEDWRHDQEDIFYRLSTDNGITWEDEERVEDDPGESGYPDIAVSGDNVHLVWNDFREDPGYGIYYSRREGVVAVYDEEVPYSTGYASLSAYPNPFNSSTILTFNKVEGGEIEIYNIMGKRIRTMITPTKEEKLHGTPVMPWEIKSQAESISPELAGRPDIPRLN